MAAGIDNGGVADANAEHKAARVGLGEGPLDGGHGHRVVTRRDVGDAAGGHRPDLVGGLGVQLLGQSPSRPTCSPAALPSTVVWPSQSMVGPPFLDAALDPMRTIVAEVGSAPIDAMRIA
jgi:hypothetical protein